MSHDIKKNINEKVVQKYKDLFKVELTVPTDARLTQVSLLSELEGEKNNLIRIILMEAYNSVDPVHKKLGTILNAIYTQGECVFVMTKEIVNSLVRKDQNYAKPNSCDTEGFKVLKSLMLKKGILREIRPSVKNDIGSTGQAGLYELIHPDFLDPLKLLVGDANLQILANKRIEWYDENNKFKIALEESNKLAESPEILEERKRVRENLKLRKEGVV